MIEAFDFVVVGAGIVGLTVAAELTERLPGCRIAVLEKEAGLGAHASGRNSGVIHSGIYYGSETLKAKFCVSGGRKMIEFAEEEGIAVNRSGKVILATSEDQLPTVEQLMRNAGQSKIPAQLIDRKQLSEIEPFAAAGPAAIHCPGTAVIDSKAILAKLVKKLEGRGAKFFFNCAAINRKGKSGLRTSRGQLDYGHLFNCAGAYADVIAKQFGLAREYALVPFKGIYWKLSGTAGRKIRANVYPVPDVSMPFLGVHLTRIFNGEVYAGPTAIPAFGRENYGILKGINMRESIGIGNQIIGMYLGNQNNFRKLAHMEMSKYLKRNFLESAKKLMPSLTSECLIPSSKVGIRPQLINVRSRKLEMDYILSKSENSMHVLNAISPAFTCSFAFSKLVVDEMNIV